MIVIPFLPIHLQGFQPQEAQAWLVPHFSEPEYVNSLTAQGPAFTGLHDGEVLVCAGLAQLTDNRGQAWAIIGANARQHMLGITREVKKFLDVQTLRRIETTVLTEFAAGHHWLLLLGFQREGTLRKWNEDGRDCDVYARVK